MDGALRGFREEAYHPRTRWAKTTQPREARSSSGNQFLKIFTQVPNLATQSLILLCIP